MDEKVNAHAQTRTHTTHILAHMPTHTHQIYTPDMKKCTLFGDTTCLKSNDALALVYRFVCVQLCVYACVCVCACVSASAHVHVCVYVRACVCISDSYALVCRTGMFTEKGRLMQALIMPAQFQPQ